MKTLRLLQAISLFGSVSIAGSAMALESVSEASSLEPIVACGDADDGDDKKDDGDAETLCGDADDGDDKKDDGDAETAFGL